MKRFISLVLVTLLALGCTVAFADADYSSMTDEELNVLLEAIQAELASRAPAEAETGDTETGEADVPEGALVFGENVVLIDQDGVQVTLTGNNESQKGGLWLEAIVVNDSDRNISVILDNASVNGWEVSGVGIYDTSSGKKQKNNIFINTENSDVTSIDDIDELDMEFYLCDSDTYDTLTDNISVTLTFPD